MGIDSFPITPGPCVRHNGGASPNTQIYEPLPPNGPTAAYIRVLDLARKSKDPEEPLRGTLRVVNLRECPKFAALSYVWGEYSDARDSIRCGDHDFPVTKNCNAALRSMRALYGPTTIWVDAICINQEDHDEKRVQIQSMQEIYTWAHTVYAWLGEGNEKTDRAVRCLKLASSLRLAPAGVPWTDGGRVKTLRKDMFFASFGLAMLFLRALIPYWQRLQVFRIKRKFDLSALDELLNRNWIRRAWTYQEIILASNPVILCGRRKITWSCLQSGLDFLSDPITPFHISILDVFRASFSYEGPKEPNLKPGSSSISRDIHSLKSFHIWRQIHRIWGKVYRSSDWNGRKFRKFPRADTESSIPNLTVSSYQWDMVELQKTWHYARLTIALWCIIGLPLLIFLVACIPWICDDYKYPPYHRDFICRSLRGSLSFLMGFLGLMGFSLLVGVFITVYVVRMPPRLGFSGEKRKKSIIGLVQALRERKATVPADQAFSLHGVLSRMQLSSSEPDYTKSYSQVYHELFFDLLCHDTSLINLLVDVGPRLSGVPSWVPDWSNLDERSWLDSRFVYDDDTLYGASLPEPQMKVGKSSLAMWSIDKGSAAFCSGVCQKTEDSATTSKSHDAPIERMVEIFAEWVHAIGTTASTQIGHDEDDLLRNVYDVLMGRLSNPSASDFETFERWLHIIQSLSVQDNKTAVSASFLFAGYPKSREFMIKCYDQMVGKRLLFITRDGKLGTGPCSMSVGDRVALLRGVAVPMIIRSTGEGAGTFEGSTFEVVGPAFVSGVMDVDDFNEATFGPDWESINLI